MRSLSLIICLGLIGCGEPVDTSGSNGANRAAQGQPTLSEARRGFTTTIVSQGDPAGPPDSPDSQDIELVSFDSPVGKLAAYLTPDPGDNKRRPAIVWITGGDNNSIGDVWSSGDRSNDQSARAFRDAGIVMMFPSQRGGNNNPGRREGFFGEVDDVLAAADHLENLSYVDPERVYLGGHSTGATLAMLIGECSDRFRGVFALGPVAAASQYGGDYIYCNPEDEREIELRSPMFWLHGVRSPMYVLEGERGNWDGAVAIMAQKNTNPRVQFFRIPGHDHFTVIAPLTELLATQINSGEVRIDQAMLDRLE